MLLRNNAEGQPSGTTVTAGNSGGGSGNAFDTVTGTVTFDNAVLVKSGNAYLFSTTTAATASLNWTTSLGGTFARLADACYFNSTAFTVGNQICRLRDNASNQIARIVTDTAGHIQLRVGTANTLVGTGTVAMSTGTTYRVEFDITVGASAPVSVTVYVGDSLTVFDTVSSATANTGTANIGEINWGIFTSTASVPAYRLDEPATSDAAGLIGPTIATPGPFSLAQFSLPVLPPPSVLSRSSLVDVVAPATATTEPIVWTPPRVPAPITAPVLLRSQPADVVVTPTGSPQPLVFTQQPRTAVATPALLLRGSLQNFATPATAQPLVAIWQPGFALPLPSLLLRSPLAPVVGPFAPTIPPVVVAAPAPAVSVYAPVLVRSGADVQCVVIRPDTGLVTQPDTGLVSRPNTGVVVRPGCD